MNQIEELQEALENSNNERKIDLQQQLRLKVANLIYIHIKDQKVDIDINLYQKRRTCSATFVNDQGQTVSIYATDLGGDSYVAWMIIDGVFSSGMIDANLMNFVCSISDITPAP